MITIQKIVAVHLPAFPVRKLVGLLISKGAASYYFPQILNII